MTRIIFPFGLLILFQHLAFAQNYGRLYSGKEESLKAIINNPKSDDTSVVAATLILGEVLFSTEKREAAFELFQKTISLADKFLEKNPPPKIISVLNHYKGNALLDLGLYNLLEKRDTAAAIDYYGLAVKQAPGDSLLLSNSLNDIANLYVAQNNRQMFFETKKSFYNHNLKDNNETDVLSQIEPLISFEDKKSIKEASDFLKALRFRNDTANFKREVLILILDLVLKGSSPETLKGELIKFYRGRKMNIGISAVITNFYIDKCDSNDIGKVSLKYDFLNFYEQVGDTLSLINVNIDLGFSFRIQKLYDKALIYFYDAYKMAIAVNDENGITTCNHYIASVYRRMGNWDSTLVRANIGIALGKKYNDNWTLTNGYEEAGYAYYGLGKYSKALQILKEAYKIKVDDKEYCTTEIASCYLALNQLDSAKHYGLLSVEFVRNNDFDAATNNTYLTMSEIYAKYKDWANAYTMFKKHIEVINKLVNSESTQTMVASNLAHDFEQKELLRKQEQKLKDELAKKDAARKNLILWFMGIGAFALIFIIVFVINRLRLTRKQKKIIEIEKNRSDMLLLNILPEEVAEELKANGSAEAKSFDEVTVMFTDFKSFTQASETMNAKELVSEINYIFSEFDKIISKHNIEKIKTIGDSYMCAGGLPVANKTNATDVVNAALEIQHFMNQLKEEREKENKHSFEIRIGIHSGPVVAGIVGIKKFAYDIWGDTVNIASRMESSGEAGKVNISGRIYELVKEKFSCTYRGKIQAKNKGEVDMYFVSS